MSCSFPSCSPAGPQTRRPSEFFKLTAVLNGYTYDDVAEKTVKKARITSTSGIGSTVVVWGQAVGAVRIKMVRVPESKLPFTPD